MSYCSLLIKSHNFYNSLSINRVILIRTVSNFIHNVKYQNVYPSSNIVYLVIFLRELMPFVHDFAIICDVNSVTHIISDGT